MSHITRGSRNDYNDWDDNLLVSSSMKEDSSCPNCKDTGFVDSGIPMEGTEECYYCKDHDA